MSSMLVIYCNVAQNHWGLSKTGFYKIAILGEICNHNLKPWLKHQKNLNWFQLCFVKENVEFSLFL